MLYRFRHTINQVDVRSNHKHQREGLATTNLLAVSPEIIIETFVGETKSTQRR